MGIQNALTIVPVIIIQHLPRLDLYVLQLIMLTYTNTGQSIICSYHIIVLYPTKESLLFV